MQILVNLSWAVWMMDDYRTFLLRQYGKSYMLETGVTRRTKAMVTGHLTSQSAIVLLVIFPWHG